MSKIYVASSWRNPYYNDVVDLLRGYGHEVFDWRNPPDGAGGFSWSSVHEDWVSWSLTEYRAALDHPFAVAGFIRDFKGMEWADHCLLLCPCGRSAHTEAGYLRGAGKEVNVLLLEKQEPELMYNLFNNLLVGWDEFKSYYNAQTNNPQNAQ